MLPSTSQDIIRALKAPEGSPSGHEFSKIQIAFQAWSQSTVYFPNKDQVIADWILTGFLKEKDKQSPSNPILNVDHWQLLASIICRDDTESSQCVKAWLTPLLNRTPLAPIFIAILDKVPLLPSGIQATLSAPFTSCFSVLWPLAKHKMNVETLLECFSATLKIVSLDSNQNLGNYYTTMHSAVASTYLSALARASNRKKLSSTFLSSHLKLWIPCVPTLLRNGLNDLYAAGAETLFVLEALCQLVDDPISNPVIQALSRIDSSIVLPSLPALLESFHQSISRNCARLFSPSQQTTHNMTENVRESVINFYNACDGLISTSHVGVWESWNVRLQLLAILEGKNVLSSVHQKLIPIISEKCCLTVDALCTQTTGITQIILDVVCAFSRIDFDLIFPYISSVLPVVAKLPSSVGAAVEFLELWLDHHKKTRTLPDYLSLMLDALSKITDNIGSGDPYEIYAAVLGGSIFEESHAEKLRKAFRSFMTPGQCLEFLAQTKSTLKSTYLRPSGQRLTTNMENSERSRKRQKLDFEFSACSSAMAVRFAFVSNVLAIVWPSLPIHSLTDKSRSGVLDEIQDVDTSVITPLLSARLKRDHSEEDSAFRSWSQDIITCSALRLQYALSLCTSFNFHPMYSSKTESRMLRLLEPSGVLPELKIEIARSLLMSASLETLEDVETLVRRLLSCIDPVEISRAVRWDGKAFRLSQHIKNSQQLDTALLHILSHRWLPTFSGVATAEELKCFVRLLFSPLSEKMSTGDEPAQDILYFPGIMPLQSPAFWELPGLRAAVLAYLNEKTSHLDVGDMVNALKTPFLPSSTSPDIRTGQAVYTVLGHTPMEYLPKSVRIDLTKKAVILDRQIVPTLLADDCSMDVLSLSREYISRSLAHAAVFDRLETDIVTRYFLDPRWSTLANSPKFPSAVTERMIDHGSTVLKSYRSDDELGVCTIIESVHPAPASSQSPFQQRLLVVVLGAIMCGSQASKFSASIYRGIKNLFSSALIVTEERIRTYVCADELGECSISPLDTDLELWCTLISLGAWISDDISVPRLGTVVAKILAVRKAEPTPSWIALHDRAILLSLSELSTVSVDEALQASDTFILIYLSLSYVNRTSGLNNSVNKFTPFRCLPPYVFEAVLAKTLEFLEMATSPGDVIAAVRLSQMLLRNTPEGTMRVTQRHVAGSLHLFLNRQGLWCTDTNASLEICRFIFTICTERPAVLRPGDVMSTWTIMSKLLCDSEKHDSSTSTGVFREIVGITSALVRHRRDLVLPGLPHLSMILKRLVAMIRAIRPGLGAKQTRVVANSFPFWFDVRQPLGAPELKALSRLLMSLTTKTMVRLVGPGEGSQKMESLARPFSKHASQVLIAYLQVVNDPLCVGRSATREELYPGLFSLCSMLSDHDREAMMLSALDGGGKAAMKTLWNEYKKQKYAGEG